MLSQDIYSLRVGLYLAQRIAGRRHAFRVGVDVRD